MKVLINLVRYGRVDLNGALNRKNYGNRRVGNIGICVWTDSIYSGSKTNKQTKRKRNSRRELQGRLMHQTNQFNHGGVRETELPFKTGILRLF
jgi:hypothetical protein